MTEINISGPVLIHADPETSILVMTADEGVYVEIDDKKYCLPLGLHVRLRSSKPIIAYGQRTQGGSFVMKDVTISIE